MFSISRFGELAQLLPKRVFQNAVEQGNVDKYVKTLRSQDLLQLLIGGQLQSATSLRQLVQLHNTQVQHHYHLGMAKVSRSTLSDALANRSAEPFKATCHSLMQQLARQQRQELGALIGLLDSTPIKLENSRFNWAEPSRTQRGRGLKIHTLMNAASKAPEYLNISSMNVNDITDAQQMPIEPSMIYVFDKGYCDYNWWKTLNDAGASFVTRLKSNAAYTVKHHRPSISPNIISDEIIHLSNKRPGGGRINQYAGQPLRLITVQRPDKRPMLLVSNELHDDAQRIADLYRQRWQVELLFKWLKQKLKLKTYWGNSENAVKLQIYAALISYLLVMLLHKTQHSGDTLSEFLITLKSTLYQRQKTDWHYYQRRRERELEIAKRQLRLPI